MQRTLKYKTVKKSLWFSIETSEIMVKNYGPNSRVPALFSREELLRHATPDIKRKLERNEIRPILATELTFEEPYVDESN